MRLSAWWISFQIAARQCLGYAEVRNPVIGVNLPDPGVLAVPEAGGYVLVGSSNLASPDNDPAFPIFFSEDLINWNKVSA